MTRAIAICLGAAIAASASAADTQSLSIVGLSGQTRAVTVADLKRLPVRELSVPDPHSKQASRYRGVALPALLSLVDAPFGEALRGKALASHVEVEAADGYRVAFSLAELDPGLGSSDVLVAFELDGKPLSGELGAFRLVVPTDKRGARWVRQVAKLRLVEPASR